LEKESERIFDCVEEALQLIKTYDRVRYDRLIRDLKRVWVHTLPESIASYAHALRTCQISARFVLAEDAIPELIAATIVHEATHARLRSCGIDYPEARRPRVEEVCVRRELAFAAELPNGNLVRERAERMLGWITQPAYAGYWTDQSFENRFVERNIEALRADGAPEWFLKVVATVRALIVRLRRRRRPFGGASADRAEK
jgi:hypothetical protein